MIDRTVLSAFQALGPSPNLEVFEISISQMGIRKDPDAWGFGSKCLQGRAGSNKYLSEPRFGSPLAEASISLQAQAFQPCILEAWAEEGLTFYARTSACDPSSRPQGEKVHIYWIRMGSTN